MTMYKVAEDFVTWLNNESSGMDNYILKLDENGDPLNPHVPFLDNEGHPVPNLGDSKIRYELYEENEQGAVHYHHVQSDYKWFVSGVSIHNECRDGQITKSPSVLKNEYGLYGDKVMDIFVFDEWFENEIEQGNKCRTARGVAGIGKSHLTIGNLWHYWQENGGDWSLWNYLGLLKHEIGHCLNLRHTFPHSSCCDASEPYFFNYSNNTMGYNTNGQVVFSPCQLDKVFNFLYNNLPEWADLENNENISAPPPASLFPAIIIDDPNGITWDEDMSIYKHIRIKSGSRLNILDSKIGLAPDVQIFVETGAMLYVENSVLTLVCGIDGGLRWSGILVEGNPNRDHPDHWEDSFNPDGLDAGRVVLLGSSVELAKVGILATGLGFSSPPFQFYWKSSGYVFSDQTDFLSCNLGIVFYPYKRANKSKILNTTFKHYIINQPPFQPQLGILLNNNFGLEIQRSSFQNIKEIGIYAMDSGFEAINGCTFSNIAGEAISALSSTGYVPSHLNIEIGKEGTSYKNQFDQNLLDIRLEGYSNLLNRIKIVNNKFTDNWSSGSGSSNQSKGIEIKRAPVEIEKNQFLDKFHSISFAPSLIESIVNNNHFIDFNTGIWYESGATHISHFLCNKFLQNQRSGVFVDAANINNQGNAVAGYGNEWERGENYSPSFNIADIRTSSGLTPLGFSGGIFDYFVEQSIPLIHPYRPLCNLTHSPTGCNSLYPFKYEVKDAQVTISNCESINPFTEHEPKTIPQLRNEMNQIEQQDSFYIYNLEYSKRAAVKYQKVISKVDSLVQLDQLLLADSLLSQEPESDYFYLRVGLLIYMGDYSTAQNVLNGEVLISEDEEDYRDIQLINIDRLTDHEFELDSTDREILEFIAEKQTTPATFARAILSLVDERSWEPLFPEDTTYQEQSRIIVSLDEDEVGTKVFPNPSKGIFNIVPGSPFSPEDYLDFKIYNVMGVKVMSGTIPSHTESFEIDLQRQTNGTYILNLNNARNQQESFIIQKH
nr:T9SS type A sorting domain-containing protein [Saprospiraceae bacterium]